MAPYVLLLMQTYGLFDSDDPFAKEHDELALGICQTLVEFYRLMDSDSVHLPDGAKTAFRDVGNVLAALYGRIAKLCFDRSMRMRNLSPKLHSYMHICLDQIMMWNPKYGWRYGDEDLVKYMIGIGYSVHPRTLAVSVLTKWLWCVFDQVLVDPDYDFWAAEFP